jgi:hypothetical protein
VVWISLEYDFENRRNFKKSIVIEPGRIYYPGNVEPSSSDKDFLPIT